MLGRLDAAGFVRIGSAVPELEAAPVVREVRGVRVALLAYYEVDWRRAYHEVELARSAADVVVVFNHWGLEDVEQPTVAQRSFARGLAHAGADLVVGAHAHVLQPVETIEGKLVAYGLGNFVFNGTACAPRRAVGGVLEVEVDTNGVRAHEMRRVHLDARGAPHWLREGETPPDAGCPRPQPQKE
jgi:poly-gamma-glutamate synthesis protein (capsule biosynthesis protein)